MLAEIKQEPTIPESSTPSGHHWCATRKYRGRNISYGHRRSDGQASQGRDGHEADVSQVDDQAQPMNYVQTFTLMPENGSYFIFK